MNPKNLILLLVFIGTNVWKVAAQTPESISREYKNCVESAKQEVLKEKISSQEGFNMQAQCLTEAVKKMNGLISQKQRQVASQETVYRQKAEQSDRDRDAWDKAGDRYLEAKKRNADAAELTSLKNEQLKASDQFEKSRKERNAAEEELRKLKEEEAALQSELQSLR